MWFGVWKQPLDALGWRGDGLPLILNKQTSYCYLKRFIEA